MDDSDAVTNNYAYIGSGVENGAKVQFPAYGLNESAGEFYELARSQSNRTRFLMRACVHDVDWTCFYDMVCLFISFCYLRFCDTQNLSLHVSHPVSSTL